MHLEKFQVDKIQNGRLSAIIHWAAFLFDNIIYLKSALLTHLQINENVQRL